MILFSIYIYWLTGDFFSWIRAQEAWGRSLDPFSFITRRASAVSELGLIAYLRLDPVDALTALVVSLALVAATYLFIKKHWLYGVLILAYMAPAILIDLPAAGRMTAVVFPMFLALALLLKQRLAFWSVVALFGFAQVILAARFFTWRTPF